MMILDSGLLFRATV